MISYFAILIICALIYLIGTTPTQNLIDNDIDKLTQKQTSDPNIKKTKKVATRQTRENVIVTYKGNKYDITSFVPLHPGGENILIENNGNDIENLMDEIGHSKNAYRMLDKYLIK